MAKNKKKESSGKKILKYGAAGFGGATAAAIPLTSRINKYNNTMLRQLKPKLRSDIIVNSRTGPKIDWAGLEGNIELGTAYGNKVRRFKAGRKFFRRQSLAAGGGAAAGMGALYAYRNRKNKKK